MQKSLQIHVKDLYKPLKGPNKPPRVMALRKKNYEQPAEPLPRAATKTINAIKPRVDGIPPFKGFQRALTKTVVL